jgi:putative oxidoreductase
MRRWLYTDIPLPGSIGLVVLRVIAGIMIAIHAWPKIQHPTGWWALAELPLPGPELPAALQVLAAVGEFFGALGFIAGFLTRVAALGMLPIMIGAMVSIHFPGGDPLVSLSGGRSWELASIYFGCSLLFLLMGPGRLSVDALVFGKERTEKKRPV